MSSATVLDFHHRGSPRRRLPLVRPSFPSPRSRRWPRTRQPAAGRDGRACAKPGIGVIAEVKRASPSRGELASISDPAKLARAYEDGGARRHQRADRAAQVQRLSRRTWTRCAQQCQFRCCARDFIVRPYQIHEARRARRRHAATDRRRAGAAGVGVDAGTYRVAGHDGAGRGAHRRGGRPARLQAGAKVIGVNAPWTLKTLDVDRDCFARIAPGLPSNVISRRGVGDTRHRRSARLRRGRRRRGARRRGAGHQWRSPAAP